MGDMIARIIGSVLISAAVMGCTSNGDDPIVVPESPDRVTDLAVDDLSDNSVTLEWTQVDDGAGAPADYAIRYGAPTITWGSASATEITVSGSQVGSTASYTYGGLDSDTDYQFQLVGYRGTLDVDAVFGTTSNVVSASTEADGGGGGITVSITAVPADGEVSLSAGTPQGGAPPYTYQWHGATTDPGSSPSAATALAGLTSLTESHTGLANGTTYYYRLVVTDDDGGTAVSGVASATPVATGSAELLLHESWSGGVDEDIWESGYEPDMHSVVSDPTGSGRGSVFRAEHLDNGGADYIAHWPYGSGEVNPTGELFLRTWIYIPADFDGSNYAKMLIVKGNRTDNLYSSFGQAGNAANGTNFFESYVSYGAPSHGDPGVHFYTYHVDMPGNYGDIDATTSEPLANRQPAPGAWHKFEFWLRQNTIGQSNGEQRVWIDDELVLEWTGLRFRTSEILQANCIALTFSSSANNAGQVWYVDDVYVYDRLPGGMAGW